MWTTLGLVLLVLVGGVLLLAALKPAEFRVERRVSINAPAASIHPLLDDFHRWEAWSPWEHIDATMQRTSRVRRAAQARSTNGAAKARRAQGGWRSSLRRCRSA